MTSQYPLMVIDHDYGDRRVRLDVRIVESFAGQPSGVEGQQTRWVEIAELVNFDFPEANKVIIAILLERFGD